MFINSADELYGPITTVRHDGRAKRISWTKFALSTRDWERVHDTRSLIAVSILLLQFHCNKLTISCTRTRTGDQDANNIQQLFSDEGCATLWRAIPEIEELLSAWEKKQELPQYSAYRNALQDGINKIMKYYSRFDDKPVYILALGESLPILYCF